MYATLLGSCVTDDPPSSGNPESHTENLMQDEKSLEEGGEEPMEIENDTVENSRIAEHDFHQNSDSGDKVSIEDNYHKKNDLPQSKQSIEEEWSTDSENDHQNEPEIQEIPKRTRERRSSNKPATIESHKEEILEKILEKPSENPAPVKLVISKKKGSIFKSRSLVSDGPKTRRALYRHKFGDPENEKKTENNTNETKSGTEYDEFGFKDDPLVRVSKEREDEGDQVSSVKCSKGDKGVSYFLS